MIKKPPEENAVFEVSVSLLSNPADKEISLMRDQIFSQSIL